MVSKVLLIFVLAISFAHAQDEPEGTAVPSEAFCSGSYDILFVLDSSSSIGDSNFEFIREFAASVVRGYDVGPEETQFSALRYNLWADSRFQFNTFSNEEDVLQAIEDIPYYGQGTHTAAALRVAANHHLQPYHGWREGTVPTISIVLTDGRAQDDEDLPEAAMLLKSKSTRVIAIGVGRAIREELDIIATTPGEDVIFLDDFNQLTELDQIEGILQRICAAEDDVNECLVDNGGCAVTCVNTPTDFYCECPPNFALSGSTACDDVNECEDGDVPNGGCSQICNNFPGGFNCSCEEGFVLTKNGRLCIEDNCVGNQCSQICNNVISGGFFCSCEPGYELQDDGITCLEIDECQFANGGCEGNCTNTPGSFFCTCPEGFGVLPSGRCARTCYVCENALSNEECNADGPQICPFTEMSCQTTVRVENGITFISKRCKQTEACVNNFIQNPRTAWSPTQCNVQTETVSVCRCCCHRTACNEAGDCTPVNTIDLFCPDPFAIFEIPVDITLNCSQADPAVGYSFGDICTVNCPSGFEPDNGITEIICGQRPGFAEGMWIGDIGSTCVDINECLVDNGGCSHTCMNTNGSFVCLCPQENPCSNQPVDVIFILDSSSSVGGENFDTMLNFVVSIGDEYDIGQGVGQVRIGVVTYNRGQIKRFSLGDATSNEDFIERVRAIEYAGSGTRTAEAIEFTLRNCLSRDEGRRPEADLVIIVITDGRSQDANRLPRASELLHEVANQVFVIGVTNRVNEQEIRTIADGETANYRIVDAFTDLDDELGSLLGDRICTQPEQPHFLTSDERTCDFDECSIANGGCSNNCTNTVGSFFCSCPPGQVTIEDGVTCIIDRCAVNNGGCEQECVNLMNDRRCLCLPGFVLIDETDCVDHNECLDELGGCSDICENLEPGFQCDCPPGLALGPDNRNCEIDSCTAQEPGFECAQVCNNVFGGTYFCSCLTGYLLADDGFNCTEIDECAVQNGGCEFSCVNTDGSFFCECPEGQALREDGRTCGILCYTCVNVLTEDECDSVVSCAPGQDACFGTYRTRNNVTQITKGCQQRLACYNNMLQNGAPSGEGPSQCNGFGFNSKCECCCRESLCNLGGCPYSFQLPTCPIFDADTYPFISYTGNSVVAGGSPTEVVAGGTAIVNCGPGFELASGGELPFILNCVYSFENGTADWNGDPADLDTCVDIDECINSTVCVPPASCVNLPGSFECQCPDEPDDYVLIDEVICERDECADPDMGGCSHNCTNTIGSYFCSCPPRLALLDDGLTCVRDFCGDAFGGCTQICINTVEGAVCDCFDGYELLEDGCTCRDINECGIDNGGCSDICTNRIPGFECSCPEGFLLDEDGFICFPDPCFEENGGCEQICTNVDGAAVCSCRPGFVLLEDGSCEDIDECALGIARCENNCTNTEGSFICECPNGQGLRPDGRTCGRACYFCQNAPNNTACNAQGIQVCPNDADSCENEVRFHGQTYTISKHCKQTLACNNNFIQNPRAAWDPVQCNGGDENRVCRCCCRGHLCNFNERPCVVDDVCNLDRADVVVVADSSSSVRFDNFQIMKAFIKELFAQFNLGENFVHAALIRYNRDVEEQFNLASVNDAVDVADAVDDMPYDGSGTRTGSALEYVLNELLREDNGDRPEADNIVITITDGNSQDSVSGPARALREDGALTFSVGVGNVEPAELDEISGDPERTFVVDNFDELSSVVLDQIRAAICTDENECLVDNGGCSHECINIVGSFICRCPEGLGLDVDNRNCVEGGQSRDDCAENNGGCSQICTDLPDGVECSCNEGFSLGDDSRTCFDTNDCFNTSCSYSCVDLSGGFFCECPADQEIADDMLTCVDRPGPADCPEGFSAIGSSCLLLREDEQSQGDAASIAEAEFGGRLVRVNDYGTVRLLARYFLGAWTGLRRQGGVFINSDGSEFTCADCWAENQPGNQNCVYVSADGLVTAGCGSARSFIVELARDEGFLIFSRTWPNGALGNLYLPTGATAVRVIFPTPIQNLNVWYGSIIEQVSRTEYIIGQNDIERQSGQGAVGFTIDMRIRFPDRSVVVEPYES